MNKWTNEWPTVRPIKEGNLQTRNYLLRDPKFSTAVIKSFRQTLKSNFNIILSCTTLSCKEYSHDFTNWNYLLISCFFDPCYISYQISASDIIMLLYYEAPHHDIRKYNLRAAKLTRIKRLIPNTSTWRVYIIQKRSLRMFTYCRHKCINAERTLHVLLQTLSHHVQHCKLHQI